LTRTSFDGSGALRMRDDEQVRLRSKPMNIFRLRRVLLLAAGIMTAGLLTPSIPAATPDEQTVLTPIHAMLDGMARRDAVAIKASTLAGATMVLMRNGKVEQITFEAFADRVERGKTQIEERIHDPLMRVDHDLAMVWAPLEFRVDGKVDHCGTDLFNLVHVDGKWLIASLSATVRKDCGAK